MKRLLVTGSSGMLGANLVAELKSKYDITGVYKNSPNPMLSQQVRLDLTKVKGVSALISKTRPDLVVHCAAITNVDECETDRLAARRTNALATRNLASNLEPETRFVYISTDSVFDGTKGHYSETDSPHPLNVYAKTKLEGERYAAQRAGNFTIIRTNIVGWNLVKGTSFIEWIFNNLNQNRSIGMFTDVIFTPITVNTLSLLIDKLAKTDFAGILNIGSINAVSKFEFGIKFADIFRFDRSLIKPVSVDTFKFKAKRPKNTSLDVLKAQGILGKLPTVEDEISKLYERRGCIHEAVCEDRKA